MMDKVRDWFGFGPMSQGFGGHGHDHGDGGHGHTHGVIDPTIATTTRGIWAIKWSFVVLAITAASTRRRVPFRERGAAGRHNSQRR